MTAFIDSQRSAGNPGCHAWGMTLVSSSRCSHIKTNGHKCRQRRRGRGDLNADCFSFVCFSGFSLLLVSILTSSVCSANYSWLNMQMTH